MADRSGGHSLAGTGSSDAALGPSTRVTLQDRRVWHASFLPPLELPDRFVQAAPKGINNAAIQAAVVRYLDEFWDAAERGIAPVFLGRAGQYKTFGAAVIARWVQFQRLPVKFVKCGQFFMDLDAGFYGAAGLKPYKEAAEVPFLVLDDFTQVKTGTRGAELMANLLDHRFSAMLPTVLTGNVRGNNPTHCMQLVSDLYRPDFARRLLHGTGASINPPKDGFYVTV